ncbi:MAG TPA: hypothetical protein VJ873_11625 [bacterium]|nr:hypothetical protein [bacterium]
MPVDIQAVLALLPEMFPGVQEIPLTQIRPNPKNPGPALSDQEVQDLADNMADRGLVNPIKVLPDKSNPLARGPQASGEALESAREQTLGVRLGAVPQNGPGPLARGVRVNPENPRLTAEGRPWALTDFRFMTLTGERRYRAAGRLGWAAIKGYILSPTEEEAVEIAYLDNDVRVRGWWAGYQSIEQLIQANPRLTQRQVATKLKMHLPQVNRALQLLPLLNPASRSLIVTNSNNSNKGIWGISEAATLRLADLGPGSILKRGVRKEEQNLWPYTTIPLETQNMVLRTLETAFDQELTEAGVAGLVRWILEGHEPEDYQGRAVKLSQAHTSRGTALSGQSGTIPSSNPLGPSGPGGNGALGTPDGKMQTGEADEPSKPAPLSEKAQHPEYRDIPVFRIRVNSFIAQFYGLSRRLDRVALSMQSTGYAKEIKVRLLSEAEKAADPDHDYELFDKPLVLKGAQMLAWPTLRAWVYDIDEWEGVRIHNFEVQHSTPLTWIEIYSQIEKILRDNPRKTVVDVAISVQEDPDLAEDLFPVLGLLNNSVRDAIHRSVSRCYEGRVNKGGFRFIPEFALPLGRLKAASPDPQETQELVEKVVCLAIEYEITLENMDNLVDWASAGNDPAQFFRKMKERD